MKIISRHFRGPYLCTQCLGKHQPKTGPDVDLMFEIGPKDNEQYVCRPCADRIGNGEEFKPLVIRAAR